jgi:hypothetical protein
MTDETPQVRLRKAIVSQKSASLPEPALPQLAQAYEILRQYDEYVTQAVFAALQGRPAEAEFLRREELDRSLASDQELPAEGERFLRQYLRYREKLDEMASLARMVIEERS